MPLFREDLEVMTNQGCSCADCTAQKAEWIHARCHPSAGLEIRYENGLLEARCCECQKPVVDVAVACRDFTPSKN